MSHRPNKGFASRRSADFIDHCGRSSSMDRMAEGAEHMVIETLLFIAFVVVGAAVVKAYEWYHDVLYGPYMQGGSIETEATMIAITLGSRELPPATTAWHLNTVIIPRRTILLAGLCAEKFGGATTAVIGYTKNSSLSGWRRETGRRAEQVGSPSGNLRRIAGMSSDKISLRSIVLIAAAMLCFAAKSISLSIGVGSWSY
jgi:hypothetical protein